GVDGGHHGASMLEDLGHHLQHVRCIVDDQDPDTTERRSLVERRCRQLHVSPSLVCEAWASGRDTAPRADMAGCPSTMRTRCTFASSASGMLAGPSSGAPSSSIDATPRLTP